MIPTTPTLRSLCANSFLDNIPDTDKHINYLTEKYNLSLEIAEMIVKEDLERTSMVTCCLSSGQTVNYIRVSINETIEGIKKIAVSSGIIEELTSKRWQPLFCRTISDNNGSLLKKDLNLKKIFLTNGNSIQATFSLKISPVIQYCDPCCDEWEAAKHHPMAGPAICYH